MKNLMYEYSLLQQLNYDNIVKSFGFFKNENTSPVSYWTVLDKIPNCVTILESASTKEPLNETQVAKLLEVILSTLDYIHGKNYSHGDLRPENILIDAEADFEQLKILGFTAASKDGTGSYKVGQINWLAPEEVDLEFKSDLDRSKRDIWSVGVLAFMLLSGKLPFEGTSDKEITDSIK
jgi:serine/threonine/tyrosine protein kinase RAD53